MSAYHERVEPTGYYEPDTTHCGYCNRCLDPQGHCMGDDCAPRHPGPAPDERCLCDCDKCRHPLDPICDDSSEHRTCKSHGRDY